MSISDPTDNRTAHDIMRAYGCLAATAAEQRAYVEVLDRMGAFASWERVTLQSEGFLGPCTPAQTAELSQKDRA